MPDADTCQHRNLSKEYWLGMDTGDKVCDDCHEVFSPAELAALRARQAEGG